MQLGFYKIPQMDLTMRHFNRLYIPTLCFTKTYFNIIVLSKKINVAYLLTYLLHGAEFFLRS
jgi:hypothetical protein